MLTFTGLGKICYLSPNLSPKFILERFFFSVLERFTSLECSLNWLQTAFDKCLLSSSLGSFTVHSEEHSARDKILHWKEREVCTATHKRLHTAALDLL